MRSSPRHPVPVTPSPVPVTANGDGSRAVGRDVARRVVLPIPPSANHLRIPSRGRLITAPEYRTWQEAAHLLVRAGMRPVERYPVAVIVTLRTPDKRRDLDNVCKPCIDALVAGGVLVDDNVRHIDGIVLRHETHDTADVVVEIDEL